MRSQSGVTRRTAVLAGLTAIAGGSIYLSADRGFGNVIPLSDSYVARSIGERFRQAYPDPFGHWVEGLPQSAAQWVQVLRRAIAEDLEHNRLVEVDGWWLAEAEVRLCVQVYLQHV